jgi:hypothetical protein
VNDVDTKAATQVARQLFDSDTHAELRAWLDGRGKLVPWDRDDVKFKRRYAHNVPFFVHLHKQLAEYASEAFGESLKPSYSFVSRYYDGGLCPLHIDRPQCYRTIDYLIDQSSFDPWPINIGPTMSDKAREKILTAENAHPEEDDDIEGIKKRFEFTEVLLYPNDAVLYSGTHQWHYRDQPLVGTADLVFFHFVQENFDGPLG